jgi:CheY-like chemotaxis protein
MPHTRGTSAVLPPVFLVDDDGVAQALVAHHLDVLGLANPRLTFSDGTEVVAACTALGTDDPLPALVLLDGQMPRMGGLELLAWLRGHPRFAEVPVVLLTSESAADSVTTAYGLGISGYLVKPVGFEALGQVLRALDLPWALV